MLSAGLESLLDSPVAAVLEELYPGLPGSVSTELMAVPGPALGLGAQAEGSVPVLTHRDTPWTSGVGNFCQKAEDLGDVLEVVSRGPAESLPEELLQLGDLEGDEQNKKRHFRKVDCSSDGYQKEAEEAQGAEDRHAEGSASTPGETWSKQEDPHFNQQEAKSSRACCAEVAGSLRSTEENQANVQVTAETLPKLPEEVQGMKADGTRIFSKAGYRNDRVSKGLPAESKECPDVDTVLARAGVKQTSILDFLEPLRVMDIGAATDHPQDFTGLEAHTAMRAGGSGVSALEIKEEKLPRRNPVNEFSASLAHCQTCQQDEHDARDFCKGVVPKQNDPCGLSSAGSCRTLSIPSSGVSCPVLKSISYLDFRNMPLENSSTAVHGIINEPPLKYLPQNVEHPIHCDHGTGCVGNRSSTSVPVEQIPAVRNKGLSSAKTDPRELSAGIGKSYSSQFGQAAEVWRKIAVGDNMEVWSRPEAQQGVDHCHSSVFSSVASFPEEFSKEKFKRIPSEGEKLKKNQWQFSLSDLFKDGRKEKSLLMETGNIASHGTGQRDISSYNTSNKIPPPSNHSCLDLGTKLEKDPPKAQLLAKDSESNTTSDGLAAGVVEAAEADGSGSLSTGKETHLFYTLNVNLPPVLQKAREPHNNECPPCTANEIPHRDKAWDNLSGTETIGASGTTGAQVTEVLLHKDKFKSSVSSRTFANPNVTSRVSQKDMKSGGNPERVITGLENEHCYTQHCNNQCIKDQCTAACASWILSGSARVGEVFLNSHSVDVDKKIEENGNLEGESSAGYNSQEAIIFPEAHFPLACGSLPCEDDWGNRGVALHGINDIPTGKNMFCSAYTAEKSAATSVRDEISNKSVEVVKLFDVCEVAHDSKVVCDREEAKEQMCTRTCQTEKCGRTRTLDSPNAPEGNQRNKTSEQLLVTYLDKNTCVHNFGFCNSLGTREQEEAPSLPADPSDCSTSACAACPAPANVSIPTQHASHREPTLCPRENWCLGCQGEFGGPGSGSDPSLETLPNQPNPGLQTTDSSEDGSESGSSLGEEVVLKAGDELPLLMHRYAREDGSEGTLKENVVNLDSSIGVRNEDCSGSMGSINDLIEEKTIKLKEHEGECEPGSKGTLKESSSESEAHGSQHCSIKPAPEKAELVFAGNKTHLSLPKMKSLVEDQENTVSAQFLPISSIHGTSMSYNPENMNELSGTENRESLSIKSGLNNTCPQLLSEPGKETSAPRGVGPSHSGKLDIQEPFNKTQVDSETLSALSCDISLPEKEKLCMSSEDKQRDNCDPYSAKVFSKDSSMTKILSVTISVKRKSSSIEIPSSESEMAPGSLNGAKSSRVCAHSKESLKGEGHCTPTDMDGTSPKTPPCEEKFKNTSKPENMNELSGTEHRESLSIKPVLNNTCPQLMSEPGKETSAPRGVGPSHSGKFDSQEPFSKTQVDSETLSALSCGISLPEEEKLCMSPENKQRHDLFSDKKFSKDSSMTKILSVIISVKRKCSNIEIPSSESEMAPGSLNGAKSSRVCAHSKESLKGEGHCTPTDMDGTSPKTPPCEEKFKNTCVEEKMGEEVAPRKKLLRNHPWALLEDPKGSGSKIVPLSTENHGKVLEEISRSNLNYVSNERKNDGKLTNLAGTSVLSATVQDCQAVCEAEASPGVQCDPTPTLHPPLSSPSDRGTEPSPNWVVCREARVPYKSTAQSTDHVWEGTEGQDTGPTHALCKQSEALGSKRLDQTEEHQVTKQKKKYEKMEVHQSDQARQEQNLEQQEKAKITPSMLHSSELLGSSSNGLVTSRNTKFEGPLEETFAVRSSERKLCSTLQEVKRPKITTDIISSQFLKTQDSEMENLNLNLGYDGIPGAFGTTNKLRGTTKKLGGPLPLRIQPGRTCKKVPTSYQLKTIRKIKKIKSPPFLELPLQISPKQENTPLESLYFPCQPPPTERETPLRVAPMPRQRARRGSLLNSLKFRKCTKEPALLSKLSAMANKLLAPAKGACDLEPRPYSSEMLPVGDRYSHHRSKNLLEAFSCINRNVHSRWAGSWCTKMFSFQPLALYPVETTKIPFSDLSHKPPTSFSDTPVFPISFHIKLDSSLVPDLTGITSQHSVHHGPISREMPAPASKWTLSFLLSQSCSDTTAFKEDSTLNKELHSSHSVTAPRTDALHPDRGRNTVAERRGGCSTLGLRTVLALSSPGCYRIWTRRRNLSSHIPTIQRLFISQLAQGLKGARYPSCVSADLVSSLPYSLGRVLSIWSQHGPSARPSEIPPLHSNHCKWQPSVGIENSYAMLPHFPAQSMEALQTAGCDIRLEASFPLPLPKPPTLAESLPSPPRLSASELQVHALDEADAPVPACLRSQDDTELKKTEPEKRPKKVSEIRIRKTVPKPDTNLTPMGLPKPKRLKKKEFSLEEIYTNKNYKSPPPARSLETIFEEPKEKNGHLISVSQQKRKRILEFQDFTLPRKRKTRGKVKAVGSFTRAKRAALQSAELDVLLSQKLMALEAFFAEEVEQEQASGI
ncbi:protein PRR14L isoform X2 [Corapipo altera]|uniref:protein PRR14L isoform X2 n=1 Tax=Corapipo altera TaxID=415028 RepID=UPI000FD64FE5|nr:protein PRR14L isoform X2 [Corapipo altera]